jgi:hypothetical protein
MDVIRMVIRGKEQDRQGADQSGADSWMGQRTFRLGATRSAGQDEEVRWRSGLEQEPTVSGPAFCNFLASPTWGWFSTQVDKMTRIERTPLKGALNSMISASQRVVTWRTSRHMTRQCTSVGDISQWGLSPDLLMN